MEIDNNPPLLKNLYQIIAERLSKNTATKLINFAQHYFATLTQEDLQNYSVEDLYGSLLSHWKLALNYHRGQQNLHIYNPNLATHNWRSPHTIIDCVIEDMPFLLQSICMEINRHGLINHLVIHPIFNFKRNKTGDLIDIITATEDTANHSECLLHLEIDRQSDPKILHNLQLNLITVLTKVRASIQDWQACLYKIRTEIKQFKQLDNTAINFLQWLHDQNFVFLGYREYKLLKNADNSYFQAIPRTGLGILRDSITPIEVDKQLLSNTALAHLQAEKSALIITKSTVKSCVHRAVFMDYIGIKHYDAQGKINGESRFLGLYSATAYAGDLNKIPIIANKLQQLQHQANFLPKSYNARAFLFILHTLPRDELFQAPQENLFNCVTGVLQLQERQRVSVFLRHDIYGNFVSLLIFVPRENYHTEARKKIQSFLLEFFQGTSTDFSVQFSESILARLHFIVQTQATYQHDYDVNLLKTKIIEILAQWQDKLQHELQQYCGETQGNALFYRYHGRFSGTYREKVTSRTALLDILQIEKMSTGTTCLLYSPLSADQTSEFRFKLFNQKQQVSLSKSLPLLENMGVIVTDEQAYNLQQTATTNEIWIHDFGLNYATTAYKSTSLKSRFETAFQQIWANKTDNDCFNKLVFNAGINWQEVNLFRALAVYLHQIGIVFSQTYIATTLAKNPVVINLLLELFKQRFNPIQVTTTEIQQQTIITIQTAIDAVVILDEDRILRRLLNLIQALVRTNYFNFAVDTQDIIFLALKFDSKLIHVLPEPKPHREIFVYSSRFEGIHLRGGKIARGGLRWSDRSEDFRTEILGLMKAQMTKNAVIVPTGAKGGFVVKSIASMTDKNQINQEVVECYQVFIQALLSLTDNQTTEAIIPAANIRAYDTEDSYLVVAADKGTASFSDYANQIALQNKFWLADAFASGGSVGYDHKAIGITARGAWESVKHHFNSLDIQTSKQDFTVVGIGGMAGDVFGNGMLLSEHICLVAAFNHQAIFLDPQPNAQLSFQERQRLFNLPKASWSDYEAKLISKGGGVYARNLKTIILTPEIKACLKLDVDKITPANLIQAILSAPVDLLWNGGIGTYVKARAETHTMVGDHANDNLRINANQLRCKVVVEAGNLGFTQLGRIEYAQNGGYINTDSIDNVAGVACSDYEVNIKILLNQLLSQEELTQKQRDALLKHMTTEVTALVLKHNVLQNQAISLIVNQSDVNVTAIINIIQLLEQQIQLSRNLECIPSDATLNQRQPAGILTLNRPEASVLLAYSKQWLKQLLHKSYHDLDAAVSSQALQAYFPQLLTKKYAVEINQHCLRMEIVINVLVNNYIDRMGIVVPFACLAPETSSLAVILNTYYYVEVKLQLQQLWHLLDNHNDLDTTKTAHNLRCLIEIVMQAVLHQHTLELESAWFIETKAKFITPIQTLISNPTSETLHQVNIVLTQAIQAIHTA